MHPGNKEQVLTHTQKDAVWINIVVHDVSLCFKENICAEDTDIAPWELGNLGVSKHQPKDPSASNFCICITSVHNGVTESDSMLAIPLSVGTSAAAETNLCICGFFWITGEVMKWPCQKGHQIILKWPHNDFQHSQCSSLK